MIVRWGPDEHRRLRWASLGSALAVVGWIGQTLIFGAYVRSVANFRTDMQRPRKRQVLLPLVAGVLRGA